MYCSNCGEKYEGNFCPKCGTPALKERPKSNDIDRHYSTFENKNNEIQIYKLSAGRMALNGERQLVTEFQVRGDEITAISYRKTSKSTPFSSSIFRKKDINNVAFQKTGYYTTLDKINIVMISFVTLLGFFLPYLFIAGPLSIILIYLRAQKETMVITLNNGTKIKAFYRSQEDTREIYYILTNKGD